MKGTIIGFIITILMTSCFTNRTLTIEGDLTFQFIDLYRIFDAGDSVISEFEDNFAKIDIDTLSREERKFYKMIEYAIEQDLLRTPYLNMKTSKAKHFKLFMDKKTYEQFDSLKCRDLRETNKKIHIVAKVKDITYKKYKELKAYQLVELIEVDEIEGETHCGK